MCRVRAFPINPVAPVMRIFFMLRIIAPEPFFPGDGWRAVLLNQSFAGINLALLGSILK
jgi:hypothetical protein